MSKLITKLSAGAIALVLAMPAQAQEELTADSVVATVNGTEITLGHMLIVRAGLPEQYQNVPLEILWNGILDQMIQQTVLTQQLDAEDSRRIALAIDNERRSLRAAQVIEGIIADEVTEEAIEAFYNETYVNGEQTEEYNASHILVDTEDEAASIVEELKGGADFADVAREKSTGPSGPNGGSLGWFGPGMMVAEFQSAVEEMEVGAISDPVQTQFGWHVITLNEKRIPEAPSLDSVRVEIEEGLGQQAVLDRIDALTEEAEITRTETSDVDVSILNAFELIEE